MYLENNVNKKNQKIWKVQNDKVIYENKELLESYMDKYKKPILDFEQPKENPDYLMIDETLIKDRKVELAHSKLCFVLNFMNKGDENSEIWKNWFKPYFNDNLLIFTNNKCPDFCGLMDYCECVVREYNDDKENEITNPMENYIDIFDSIYSSINDKYKGKTHFIFIESDCIPLKSYHDMILLFKNNVGPSSAICFDIFNFYRDILIEDANADIVANRTFLSHTPWFALKREHLDTFHDNMKYLKIKNNALGLLFNEMIRKVDIERFILNLLLFNIKNIELDRTFFKNDLGNLEINEMKFDSMLENDDIKRKCFVLVDYVNVANKNRLSNSADRDLCRSNKVQCITNNFDDIGTVLSVDEDELMSFLNDPNLWFLKGVTKDTKVMIKTPKRGNRGFERNYVSLNGYYMNYLNIYKIMNKNS